MAENDLMDAAKRGDHATAEAVLDAGAVDINTVKSGMTALMQAAMLGHEAVLKLLVDRRASLDHQVLHGGTALMYAANEGQTAAAEFLIMAGADTALAWYGKTARDYALENKHTAIVAMIDNAPRLQAQAAAAAVEGRDGF